MTPLCFHLLPDATAADLAWAIAASSNGAWVKVCKPEQIAPLHNAGLRAYYRPYLPGGDDNGTASGKSWAESVITAVQGAGGQWPDAIGYRNEMSCTQANVTEYAAYRTRLQQAGYKGLTVLGSFGVGNPDWPEYALLASVQPDAIELHEYWDLTVAGSSVYWALRHVEAQRRGLLSATTHLFIGECGSDGIVKELPDHSLVPVEDPQGRHGWQDRGKLTPAQQSANIAAYSAGCAANVVAAFVFGDGGTDPHWLTYHTQGTPVQTAIAATQKGPPPVSPPPPTPPAAQTDYAGAGWVPSPNFWAGRQGQTLKAIVLHGTAGGGAVQWFSQTASQVSAHYVVDTDGTITQCVREADSAWHAGVVTANSAYASDPNPNLWTIGIEHVRDTTNTSAITPAQLAASTALVTDIVRRHGQLALIEHDQIDVGRVCPGPGFPLAAFQAAIAPVDPVIAAALQRFSALGVQPNQAGALFAAYVQRTKVWLDGGKANVLDPTPAIRPEVNTGQDAYVALDCGEIYHWRAQDGLVYLVEASEREAVWKECGW